MKTKMSNGRFDTMLETSDWRYSAAITGLIKYFKFYENSSEPINYQFENDYLLYNSSDITKERYVKFVENYYGERLHHVFIENILINDDFTDEQVKLINDKLNINSIMKKVFGKIKFDKTNKEEILKLIAENRCELITETYKRKLDMYINYSNPNLLFEEAQDCCRLNGYYLDMPKKGKSVGYRFDTKTFVSQDEQEFDFIPFAFIGDRESLFINDSMTVNRLFKTNSFLHKLVKDSSVNNIGREDVRTVFFKALIEATDFIDYDIEVIVKDRENDYFETLYIRKKAIGILKKINDFKVFCFSLKINENYYINIQKKVTDCILNNILLDELIEMFLKNEEDIRKKINRNIAYLVDCLIKVNVRIRGGEMDSKAMKGAIVCAKKVVEGIEENKLNSYRQKLISAIVFKDYDRVCQILLQLSNYSNVGFDFAYDLYEDFENNKEIAYAFITALRKNDYKKNNEGETSDEK